MAEVVNLFEDLKEVISSGRSVSAFLTKVQHVGSLELLKVQDRDGWTTLNYAVVEKNTQAVFDIIDSIPKQELYSHLMILTKLGNTAVQIASRWNLTEMVKKIFSKLEGCSVGQQWCLDAILCHHNLEGKTAILCAADYYMVEAVMFLLGHAQKLGEDNYHLMKMLKIQDKRGWTILHMLAQFPSDTYILQNVLEALPNPSHREDLFALQDKSGETVLHRFAVHQNDVGIRCLLSHMTGFKSTSVLDQRNFDELTARDLATSKKIKNLLSWAVSVPDDYYYLPTPPAFVILSRTIGRQGGEAEKESISRAVSQDFNIEPVVVENPTQSDVFQTISKAIEQAGGSSASGLIVVVMSHGQDGSFVAEDGDVEINEVLTHMCQKELDGKPKVLIVQACQLTQNQQGMRTFLQGDAEPTISITTENDKSKTRAPEQNHLYSSEQRHCLVMSSTVRGALAIRNTLIPAFAAHLSGSTEEDDIYSIFLKAHHTILLDPEVLNADMIPKFTSTLDKKLSLRKIFKEQSKSSGGLGSIVNGMLGRQSCVVM